MARIRTVKPEFFQHEGLHEAEIETGLPLRLAYIGLWTQCDREGRFEWRPRRLKLNILPWDEVDFSRVLDALSTRGFLVHYASGGHEFGAIPSWRRHQVINNRERESEIPEPSENNQLTTRAPRVDDACLTPLVQVKAEGKGTGTGKEGEGSPPLPPSGGNGSKRTRFSPPTIDDVRSYCRERGNSVAPEVWMDHYTSNGWKVGRNGMKDWKAAVRTWERSNGNGRSNGRFETPYERMQRVNSGGRTSPAGDGDGAVVDENGFLLRGS